MRHVAHALNRLALLLDAFPTLQRGVLRVLRIDVEAAGLVGGQAQHARLLRVGEEAGRKTDDARRAFLAAEFLALHEVQQGDQDAGDAGVQRGISGFEHHGQQAADDLREARVGVVGGHGVVAHLAAQARQFVQTE
ncbi:hypothetical protein D3C72_1777140 [compost metagenome]